MHSSELDDGQLADAAGDALKLQLISLSHEADGAESEKGMSCHTAGITHAARHRSLYSAPHEEHQEVRARNSILAGDDKWSLTAGVTTPWPMATWPRSALSNSSAAERIDGRSTTWRRSGATQRTSMLLARRTPLLFFQMVASARHGDGLAWERCLEGAQEEAGRREHLGLAGAVPRAVHHCSLPQCTHRACPCPACSRARAHRRRPCFEGVAAAVTVVVWLSSSSAAAMDSGVLLHNHQIGPSRAQRNTELALLLPVHARNLTTSRTERQHTSASTRAGGDENPLEDEGWATNDDGDTKNYRCGLWRPRENTTSGRAGGALDVWKVYGSETADGSAGASASASTCNHRRRGGVEGRWEKGRRTRPRAEAGVGLGAAAKSDTDSCSICKRYAYQLSESHHVVVIDVHAADEPKCCCVCMEPLKWVAVGRCGHRDVCGGCATRIRFFLHDRRCCICRTNCPTVLVTKADTNRRASSRPLQSGVYQWYHGGTGASFDDWHKYMATVRAYDVRPPLPAAASGGTTGGRTPSDVGGAASWPGGPNDPLLPPPEDDECQPVTGGGAAASPCISRTPTAAYINPFESSCQGGTSFPFHGGRRRREVDHLELLWLKLHGPWLLINREAMALLPSIFTGVADCIYACTSNGVRCAYEKAKADVHHSRDDDGLPSLANAEAGQGDPRNFIFFLQGIESHQIQQPWRLANAGSPRIVGASGRESSSELPTPRSRCLDRHDPLPLPRSPWITRWVAGAAAPPCCMGGSAYAYNADACNHLWIDEDGAEGQRINEATAAEPCHLATP
ncbi:hypothetical protein HU200_005195 [Digitaria exilis]|uniref:RING-type domain-containing protein n=1 Tax=Digitaria exilis TaxID=1010633 RepID=A0A835FR51_9POAL|nr:hypothetical protein HU200_005195 [Digitaria exilis]